MAGKYKTSKAAKLAGISPTSARDYGRDFADFFSPGANPPKGETRYYTDRDIFIMSEIYRLRGEGKTEAEIEATLADMDIPELPPIEPPIEEHDPDTRQLQVAKLAATVAQFQGELSATKEALGHARSELEQERSHRVKAEIRAASAETRAEMLQSQIEELKQTAVPEASPDMTMGNDATAVGTDTQEDRGRGEGEPAKRTTFQKLGRWLETGEWE